MDRVDYKKISATLVGITLSLVVYIANDMRQKVDIIPELQQDLALMNQQMDFDRKAIKRVITNLQGDIDELKDGTGNLLAADGLEPERNDET
ncbi:hypothetical protein VCHA31O73_360009 [Vibrio chagasii]|nr:hypothetical protein VCHA31O73_360009 [Vibrio chagasii]